MSLSARLVILIVIQKQFFAFFQDIESPYIQYHIPFSLETHVIIS
jgi:hypothetical protein